MLEGDVAELARSPCSASLTHLLLRRCHLDDEGVKALADSPHLAGLRVLDLRFNWIRRPGALALMRSPHLHLASLDLSGNHLDAATRREVVQHFGRRVVVC